MDSDTAAIVAAVAAALALASLVYGLLLARRIRRLREAQTAILGENGSRDLIAHASYLERRLEALGSQVEQDVRRLEERDAGLGERLDGAITHCGVVRYDAMGEMTGRQSSSVALLDSAGTGVVLSSILHRDQARLYAKPVVDGSSEFDLSPEESQALQTALGDGTA